MCILLLLLLYKIKFIVIYINFNNREIVNKHYYSKYSVETNLYLVMLHNTQCRIDTVAKVIASVISMLCQISIFIFNNKTDINDVDTLKQSK